MLSGSLQEAWDVLGDVMNRTRYGAKSFAAAGLLTAVVGCLVAAGASAQTAVAGTSFPQQVYASYFETWTADSLVNTARQSGSHYFTMAFIQTAYSGSCTPTWHGNPKQPVSASSYGNAIAQLRSLGGDVIVSFGGSAADNSGTELADSCGSVSRIAAAYESVIS